MSGVREIESFDPFYKAADLCIAAYYKHYLVGRRV